MMQTMKTLTTVLLLLAALFIPSIAYAGSDQVGPERQAMLTARLQSAAGHVCAYSGQQSRECDIASGNHVRWEDPRPLVGQFTAVGLFQPEGRLIWLDGTITNPATLGAVLLHEISHYMDADMGRCCWSQQCVGTETRAYTKEIDYWHWVIATWGEPALNWQQHTGDDTTSFLSQLARNPTYAHYSLPQLVAGSCQAAH